MNVKSIRTLLVAMLLSVVVVQNSSAAIIPTMIPNLKGWYQPSTLGSGPSITSWPDSSPNGYNLTPGGDTNPTLVFGVDIGQHKGVHFNKGVKDPLIFTGFNNAAASTIFVVAKVANAPADVYDMFLDGDHPNRQALYFWNDDFSMYAGAEVHDALGGAGGTNDGALHRFSALFNSNLSIGGIDGVEGGFVNPGSNAITRLTVGDHTGFGDNNDATVDILEVIIYDRALSLSERQQIDQYLFEKFFVAPVPEPSTLALLGLGTIGLAIRARRRRRATA